MTTKNSIQDSLKLMNNTVVMLAKNSIPYERKIHIDGLLVISADGKPPAAIHINQLFTSASKFQQITSPAQNIKPMRAKEESNADNNNSVEGCSGQGAGFDDKEEENESSDHVKLPTLCKAIDDCDVEHGRNKVLGSKFGSTQVVTVTPERQMEEVSREQQGIFTKVTPPKKNKGDRSSAKRQRLSLEQGLGSPTKRQKREGDTPTGKKAPSTSMKSGSFSKASPVSPTSGRDAMKGDSFAPVGDGRGFTVMSSTTYACNMCGRNFKHQRNIPRHQKDVHGIMSVKQPGKASDGSKVENADKEDEEREADMEGGEETE